MKRNLIALVLVLTVSGMAAAQRGQRGGNDQTISVEVNLVNIPVIVADNKGKFVTNLKKEDFKVYEDDKLQTITNFSSESNLPLTIALVVDTSGSIRERLKFEQDAAIEFFYSTLQRGKDKAVIVSFDSAPILEQDYTDDPEKLANAVRKIRAGGGTALFDALYLAVTKKLAGQNGRRVAILITDGDDNSSRVSMTEALEAAQKNDVTIYSISTNSVAFGSKEQQRGDTTLKSFSEETGGKPFFPMKVQDLAISFLDIHDELRSQYQLGYRPTNAKADGTFRRIRVDVAEKRFKARARDGYYMPKAAADSPK